jgi:hypothetical protein
MLTSEKIFWGDKMARKRKYKTLEPYEVSRTAWEHLTEAKKIDQMVTNYSN